MVEYWFFEFSFYKGLSDSIPIFLEGYAKINRELIEFISEFEKLNGIPLDYIYTGKMIYGIFDLLKSGYFKKNERIIALHTGGLQGNAGIQTKIEKVLKHFE